jgi:hypothetical protein
METITDLIDFLYRDKVYQLRQHVLEQVVRSPDNNKGHFWEQCLEKAMKPHTKLVGGNTKGYDFLPCKSDAKFSTFYKRSDGVYEASVGIENKIGTLRVCLVAPGHDRHRLYFLLIPYKAYIPYQKGSQSIKITLTPNWTICNKWRPYVCKWEDVTKYLGSHIS